MMPIDTGTDVVLAEIVDGVGIVTLNRPERRNALHPDMFRVIPEVLIRFEQDPEVHCILITGAGTAFCAGGDVRDGAARRSAPPADGPPPPPNIEEAGARLAHDARMVTMLYGSEKVTMAALPGAAVGAGLGIALSTDLRIAARSAKLIGGWGKLGFSGDFGGPWLLTRLVGPSRALEILVDDRPIRAEEAERIGLVNRVVDDDVLVAEAMAWARSIADKPQMAQQFQDERATG